MEIGPGTKVYKLLEEYPQLEEDLILLNPGFERLKNPMLRNTVARFVTLRQAAFVSGMDAMDLVNFLRQRVGQRPLEELPPEEKDEVVPRWLSQEPAIIIDVERLLKKSHNPLETITCALDKVGEGEIVLLRSPFRPDPLMEIMRSRGIEVFSAQEGPDFYTYFRKPSRS